MPTLSLYSVDINKVKIDIIHIANSPNKPYFLLKDKSVKGVKIRAGVIYTRDNDSNTPKNSTASVTQIEKMWRERFGLDKSPLERVRNYLFDIPGWHSADKNEFYYQSFPEFRIVVEKEPLRKDFFEYWINKEDPCKLAMAEAKIYFHNTVIKKYDIINLEHKTYFPVPEYFDPENAHKNGKAYILVQNIENFVCAIMRETKDIKSYKWAFIHRNGFNTPVEVYHHYLRLHFLTHNLNLQLINKEELEAINKEVRF